MAIDPLTAATWVTAAATVVLSIFTGVTLWFLNKQETRALRDRYDQLRPLLSPTSDLPFVNAQEGVLWTHQNPALLVRNVGTGVALNVAALLLGSRGSAVTISERFTAWHPLPLPPDPTPQMVKLNAAGSTILSTASIASFSVCAPDKPSPAAILNAGEPWYVLRLVLTYEDIFRRKHAAIFDYTSTGRWQTVAICEDIKVDLHSLQNAANASLVARSAATLPSPPP